MPGVGVPGHLMTSERHNNLRIVSEQPGPAAVGLLKEKLFTQVSLHLSRHAVAKMQI